MSTTSSDENCAPTERKPTERAPTRATEIVRLEIAQLSIESGVTFGHIVQRACASTAQTLGVSRVGAWVLVNDRTALKCFKLFEATTGSWSAGAMLQVADFPEYFQQLKHRKIVPAESAQSDPKTLELVDAYLKPLGITSLLDAPIFVGGEVIGVFCCEHVGPPREWTTEERDFVASIADLLAAKYRAVQVQKLQRTLEVNESRLFTLEKSDALAKMALGVAHDFRNMLVSITNSAHVLKLAHNLPEDLRESAEIIKEAAEMGERLVSELIDYGRNAPAKPEVINIDNAIDKFLPFVRTAVGRDHEILVEHSPATGRVFIDRNQLDRVLLNLVVNAREASPPGSKIRIRTDQCVPEVDSQANYVTLEISDSGKGMDEQTRQRLFEPFFSTKNRGSGLGMAVVQRIVDRAGGFISVDSQLGQGTTIRVHLPRVSVSD